MTGRPRPRQGIKRYGTQVSEEISRKQNNAKPWMFLSFINPVCLIPFISLTLYLWRPIPDSLRSCFAHLDSHFSHCSVHKAQFFLSFGNTKCVSREGLLSGTNRWQVKLPYLALCILFIWLFLVCIIFNKLAIKEANCFPESCESLQQRISSRSGLRESLICIPLVRSSKSCDYCLKWGSFVGWRPQAMESHAISR